MTTVAVDPSELKPIAQLSITMPLLAVMGVCLLLAVALATLAVLLSRPRKAGAPRPQRGAHRPSADKTQWRRRIDAVVARYHKGELSREEAFVALARIARDFSSVSSGRNLSSHTLTDLSSSPRGGAAREGLNLLRQTIEALYPPEFADAAINSRARGVDVDEAAGWVSNLVERWRR